MPELSRFFGIIIAMFGDDHNPPHFHVRYGDNEAIITIKDGIVKGELPRKVLKDVFKWMTYTKLNFLKIGKDCRMVRIL